MVIPTYQALLLTEYIFETSFSTSVGWVFKTLSMSQSEFENLWAGIDTLTHIQKAIKEIAKLIAKRYTNTYGLRTWPLTSKQKIDQILPFLQENSLVFLQTITSCFALTLK